MNWLRRDPASSEKSQEDPPPYDDDPSSVPEKIIPSDSADLVASGPPIIAGKKVDFWIDWSKPHFSAKYRNPGLLGVWPYEPGLQRDDGLLFRTRASCNQMTSLHPGEREHVIHPDKDWAKQWTWAIFIRVLSNPDQPTSNFGCNLQILVKDLPARLRDKEICWNTVNWNSKYDIVECKREISQKESFWMRYLAFSTPEPLEEKPLHSRSWVAEVAVKHKDVEWLKNHDFRTTPSPKNIEIAEIDQRTAPGRCKKVVMFHRGTLYGNDMTGQRVEAWKDEFTESFGAFIEPMLSYQRSC
ncbi:hypothetical protein MRS44_004346 [Fusarium solani]|uniref:Uncharacterized protein n=1 Tax=Fusarium solani TaxID=169388 RepID=A0A9P9RB04_FUSSL|nr:uncharacterized protein B0J15DRAFT_522805 [Fusarium solani]KAH7271913.1 hypothetical protein B0J15DRAFT_522805 [Fusarium solani]KAJ3466782.1 hypothetical protein MRS44_004346 [Fusarium solani]